MRKVGFKKFFHLWAERMGWVVPKFHDRICDFMEEPHQESVLMVFRGGAKSTTLALYNAWKFYIDNNYRILHQGADDRMALKTSRDTQNVLRHHPLTEDLLPDHVNVQQWWVEGASENDSRNSSFLARGILSNVTSSRADECQNDDIEVPKNIISSDLRERLRARLAEQTHVLVPGGITRYLGTPHTFDSVYEEEIAQGAASLKIPLFSHHHRENPAKEYWIETGFTPEYVFLGIGRASKLLVPDIDYKVVGTMVLFTECPRVLVDIYADCVWPERFTRQDIAKRRAKCRGLGEWDSQYQLDSRPIYQSRLETQRLIPYSGDVEIERVNGQYFLRIGETRMVGVAARWDCALGKLTGDDSVLCVVFTDGTGHLYWHAAKAVIGELDSQCLGIRESVLALHLPSVTVETNGAGGFVPPILRKHLKGICSVQDDQSVMNKAQRIIFNIEPALSGNFLHIHESLLSGPAVKQMRDWNPRVKNQRDDFLDALAGAIQQTPVRIGQIVGRVADMGRPDWRPGTGSFEVNFDVH